jgi:hypothetical protein
MIVVSTIETMVVYGYELKPWYPDTLPIPTWLMVNSGEKWSTSKRWHNHSWSLDWVFKMGPFANCNNDSRYCYNGSLICLVVSNILLFSIIDGIILPIDELIFFKMVIAPPTSSWLSMWQTHGHKQSPSNHLFFMAGRDLNHPQNARFLCGWVLHIHIVFENSIQCCTNNDWNQCLFSWSSKVVLIVLG